MRIALTKEKIYKVTKFSQQQVKVMSSEEKNR